MVFQVFKLEMYYGNNKQKTYRRRRTKTYHCSQSIPKGEDQVHIYKTLGKSRGWLYKWIKRHKNAKRGDKRKWFHDHSRAPKNIPRKTDTEIEKLVVNVRKSLVEGKTEDTKYRCISN